VRHHVSRHAGGHVGHRHHRHARGWDAGVAKIRARGLEGTNASLGFDNYGGAYSGGAGTSAGFGSSFGSSNVVAEARRYLGGGNPTGRASLWCARFMNMVLQHTGYRGTGSDMARSFASYGRRVSGPQIGAIAVMGRRGGGHVGVVSGIDAQGNPIVVSGNYGHRVMEASFPRGRIYAYVLPTS
jgi:uncharacterized protein (TIGR02594 family)